MTPFERLGAELELLAPTGRTRFDLATVLARVFKGRVEHGFKYFSEGTLPDGRPLCRLSWAARVVTWKGVVATLVDDNTLRDGLTKRPVARSVHATDELRLALLVERLGWSDTPERRLERVRSIFSGFFEGGALRDAFGHSLVVPLQEPASWQRVTEIVTRPLERTERTLVLRKILSAARDEGCTIPRSAALHVHFDAAPWRSVRSLSGLILHHHHHRDRWWRELSPNRACKKLGPFPPGVVRVAQNPKGVGFGTFAAALALAGASKDCDLNVRGVIEPHPRQPTLEVRCLPMSLEPVELLTTIAKAEALLGEARSTRRFPRAAG